jgi:hypothetical protein
VGNLATLIHIEIGLQLGYNANGLAQHFASQGNITLLYSTSGGIYPINGSAQEHCGQFVWRGVHNPSVNLRIAVSAHRVACIHS